jgi:hypothetical protein
MLDLAQAVHLTKQRRHSCLIVKLCYINFSSLPVLQKETTMSSTGSPFMAFDCANMFHLIWDPHRLYHQSDYQYPPRHYNNNICAFSTLTIPNYTCKIYLATTPISTQNVHLSITPPANQSAMTAFITSYTSQTSKNFEFMTSDTNGRQQAMIDTRHIHSCVHLLRLKTGLM